MKGPVIGRITVPYRTCHLLRKNLHLQKKGIKEVDDGIWLVSFMDYDLGYIDLGRRLRSL